jgi:trimeric autotransporter adhesin
MSVNIGTRDKHYSVIDLGELTSQPDLNVLVPFALGGDGVWSVISGGGTCLGSYNSGTDRWTLTRSMYDEGTGTVFKYVTGAGVIYICNCKFYTQPVAGINDVGYPYDPISVVGLSCEAYQTYYEWMIVTSRLWFKYSGPGNVTFTPNTTDENVTITVDAYGTYIISLTINNGPFSNTAYVTFIFSAS